MSQFSIQRRSSYVLFTTPSNNTYSTPSISVKRTVRTTHQLCVSNQPRINECCVHALEMYILHLKSPEKADTFITHLPIPQSSITFLILIDITSRHSLQLHNRPNLYTLQTRARRARLGRNPDHRQRLSR